MEFRAGLFAVAAKVSWTGWKPRHKTPRFLPRKHGFLRVRLFPDEVSEFCNGPTPFFLDLSLREMVNRSQINFSRRQAKGELHRVSAGNGKVHPR